MYLSFYYAKLRNQGEEMHSAISTVIMLCYNLDNKFKIKPENCYERLLDVIGLGSSPDGIEKSYREWCGLVEDLKRLCGL